MRGESYMNGRTNVVNNNSDSLGGIIPLEAPNTFVVVADNAKCLLTWTDPKDKYADELGEITDEGDQLVSQFAYTRIVRKTTGYPSGPNDGDIVTESSTRNQYQSTAYSDEGLVNNTTYYYAAFACNTDGVWSGSVTGSATPKAYDPILANNTWEQINEVANEGIAASVWEVGDEIDITLTTEETLTIVILDFNHDVLSDGSGTTAITFGTKHLMADKAMVINPASGLFSNEDDIKYWQGPLKTYLTGTVQSSLPSDVMAQLRIVSKTSCQIRRSNFTSSGAYVYDIKEQRTESYYIFAFAVAEVYHADEGATYGESVYDIEGSVYKYYTTASNRIKLLANGTGSAAKWFLRTSMVGEFDSGSTYPSEYYYKFEVHPNGNPSHDTFNSGIISSNGYTSGVCFGFCIGKTPS